MTPRWWRRLWQKRHQKLSEGYPVKIPMPDPLQVARENEARRAMEASTKRLEVIGARDKEIEQVTASMKKIYRENHLAYLAYRAFRGV